MGLLDATPGGIGSVWVEEDEGLRVLAMDTCGAEGSVAAGRVDRDGTEVLAESEMPGRSASERLVAAMRGCCERAGWRAGETEAVVVVHGPGSFTGVRVGVSAAKGLAEASGAGVVTVSRLEVLARQAGVDGGGRVWAVLDAGRGEVFAGLLEGDAMAGEWLRTIGELREEVRTGDRVVGCEATVRDRVGELAGYREVRAPTAGEAMRVAAGRLRRGIFTDAAEVDALYLRRTEVEIQARMARRAEDR